MSEVKKMTSLMVLPLLSLVLLSCNQTESESNIDRIADRIAPERELANAACIEQTKGYYERFGYHISNYYKIDGVEAKDLNSDNIIDSIAILTPYELLPAEIPEYAICHKIKGDSIEDRLLIINLMRSKDGSGSIIRTPLLPGCDR